MDQPTCMRNEASALLEPTNGRGIRSDRTLEITRASNQSLHRPGATPVGEGKCVGPGHYLMLLRQKHLNRFSSGFDRGRAIGFGNRVVHIPQALAPN